MPSNTTISNLNIDDVVSFICYGSVIPNVVNGVYKGIEDGSILRIPSAAAATHASIYSSLPTTPTIITNNYQSYDYILVQLSTGTLIEIGVPWIQPSSLTKLTNSTATIILPGEDISGQAALQSWLTQGGYPNATITYSTN